VMRWAPFGSTYLRSLSFLMRFLRYILGYTVSATAFLACIYCLPW
jgi:hypothetical protein